MGYSYRYIASRFGDYVSEATSRLSEWYIRPEERHVDVTESFGPL